MPALTANISIATQRTQAGDRREFARGVFGVVDKPCSVFHRAEAGTASSVGSANTRATGANCETSRMSGAIEKTVGFGKHRQRR